MKERTMIELRSAKPSILMRITEWALKTVVPSIFPPTPKAARKLFSSRPPPREAPMPRSFQRQFRVENWDMDGFPCLTLHPKKEQRGEKHIIFLHGGGFVLPIHDLHWTLCSKLAKATGASVTVALYPLVPENPRSKVEQFVDSVYRRVAKDWDPSQIIMAGDSAGAYLSLAFALRQKEKGQPQPSKLVLMSPLLDLTLANEKARETEKRDAMLKIDVVRTLHEEFWVGSADEDMASPKLSPLYADVQGLPPMSVFVGQNDIFLTDCQTFQAKANEAGVPVSLYEYAGAPHDYMVVGFLTRETKDTVDVIQQFIAD